MVGTSSICQQMVRPTSFCNMKGSRSSSSTTSAPSLPIQNGRLTRNISRNRPFALVITKGFTHQAFHLNRLIRRFLTSISFLNAVAHPCKMKKPISFVMPTSISFHSKTHKESPQKLSRMTRKIMDRFPVMTQLNRNKSPRQYTKCSPP